MFLIRFFGNAVPGVRHRTEFNMKHHPHACRQPLQRTDGWVGVSAFQLADISLCNAGAFGEFFLCKTGTLAYWVISRRPIRPLPFRNLNLLLRLTTLRRLPPECLRVGTVAGKFWQSAFSDRRLLWLTAA